MDELAKLDATAQAEMVRRGDAKPVELVQAAIDRIERLNPQLNAVIHKRYQRALDEARGSIPDGPFRGVPFLLKDLGAGNLAGEPIHWGTRFLKDAGYCAKTTSHLVNKFRAAGLVVVGRTNVPELGAWSTTEPASYGPTRNPWNPAHSSGGSSGGAAAADRSRNRAVRACQRRRRFDSQSRQPVRPRRVKAEPRPHLARTRHRRVLGRDGVRVCGHPFRARYGHASRLRARRDARRSLHRIYAHAVVSRGGRVPAGKTAHRRDGYLSRRPGSCRLPRGCESGGQSARAPRPRGRGVTPARHHRADGERHHCRRGMAGA